MHVVSFLFFAAAQLARQLHQEHTQVVCSNKEAWRRLARRHSRNGPWTHECCFEVNVFVCWDCIYNVECCLKWCICMLILDWGIGMIIILRVCLSFFLGFQKPNLSTGLNQWLILLVCLIDIVCVCVFFCLSSFVSFLFLCFSSLMVYVGWDGCVVGKLYRTM